MQEKPPFSLSAEQVYKRFKTRATGLKSAEAFERLAKNGPNQLKEGKKHGKWYKYFSQYKDVMVIILLIAAVINLVVAIVANSAEGFIDVAVIVGIVILNTIIGYIQEDKAEKALDSLKEMSEPYSKVFRDGEVKRIPTHDIVVGDVLLLEAGDIIGADCVLVDTNGLSCDESSLTGESKAVQKTVCQGLAEDTPLGDRVNMAFSGCNVTFGRALGVVVATGMDTELGHIAKMLEQGKPETTPIQQKLNKLGKMLSIMVIVLAVVIFVVNVAVRGSHNVIDALLTTIAIAVAAIPESLPAVVTIVMATGVSRMAKRRAVVKKLHAVETLGSCQIICSDKTGTLTQNKMTVKTIFADNKLQDCKDFDIKKNEQLINAMVLCNDAIQNKDGFVGDPTEIGLLEFAQNFKITKKALNKKYPRKLELPFDSERKVMTTFNDVEGKMVAYTKGAPDVMLKYVTKILIDGQVRAITEEDKKLFNDALEEMSSQGLRTLALACRLHINKKTVSAEDERDLALLGIVAMQDPPRPTARSAVEECHKAGIKTVMISGDYVAVAKEIATEVGIYNKGDKVLTGAELDKLSDEEFEKIIQDVTVYARVSPQNKLRIVQTWKKIDKIVAMTGDGVNDAPSLKEADIGVGMGITGTEVTKQVADMVLTDDNFATIVGAVEEGRRTYQNIQKVVAFLIGSNLVEVFTILICTLAFPTLTFFNAIQILVINLITDALPAIALCVERAEKDVMSHPPRAKNEGLFHGMWSFMLVQCVWHILIIVGTFVATYYTLGATPEANNVATTMAFVTLSLTELFYIINIRSFHSIFTQNPFYNKWFWITLLGSILIDVILVAVPAVAGVMHFVPLNIAQWAIVFGVAFTIVPVMELFKLFRHIVYKKRQNKKMSKGN